MMNHDDEERVLRKVQEMQRERTDNAVRYITAAGVGILLAMLVRKAGTR